MAPNPGIPQHESAASEDRDDVRLPGDSASHNSTAAPAAGRPRGQVIDRRAFLGAFVLLAAPRVGEAQSTTPQLPRIGILLPYAAADPVTEKMRQAFRALGHVEGRTIAIEWRHVGSDTARLQAVAAELARLE